MKRKACLFLSLVLLLTLALSACGASSGKSESYVTASAAGAPMAPMEEPAAVNAAADSAYEYDYKEYASEETAEIEGGIAAGSAGQREDASAGQMNTEKIIYNAYAQVETTDYEGTVQGVYDMVARFGGFMESTSVSGTNYYNYARGRTGLRSASFTIRVPSENFKTLTSSLSELGNVPYCNTSSSNITARYYDTQSRLTAYRTQETRLLEMLEIAETVEDMLAIQRQLTEVQYEIDSLQSTLTNYDRQVNYSTVNLDVQEVEEYTEPTVVAVSYWEKMVRGFRNSLKNVGTFFSDLFLWIVSNLPALILWALVIFIAVRLFLYFRRKHREEGRKGLSQRREERKARRQEKRLTKKNGGDGQQEP